MAKLASIPATLGLVEQGAQLAAQVGPERLNVWGNRAAWSFALFSAGFFSGLYYAHRRDQKTLQKIK